MQASRYHSLYRLNRILRLGTAMLVFLAVSAAYAMEPPQKAMIEQYRQDGTLKSRLDFARQIGNHQTDPSLIQDANARLVQLAKANGVNLQAPTTLPTPPLAWAGMPTKGNVKVLILCIDFSDYPHDDTNNSNANITARIFGDTSDRPAPYESLKSYYYRASYCQLTLSGNVLGWYRASAARSSISMTTAGRQNLIKEALNYYNGGAGGNHDFAQYDNNGDGKIDYFAVIWTGPDNGWSGFWWGYQTGWSNSTDKFDGKSLGKYSWQWETKSGYTWSYPKFDPLVLTHETGHALGLPDYYDYDGNTGPDGGVGGLDMMDANKGDHNCFSKFLLDWITPSVYTTTTSGLTLVSSGDHKDNSAAIVMDTSPGGCFGEYFMVQNRYRVANDASANYPADGLLIWHVDSRLDTSGADFLYDNSYTEHKLLRLMEADGLEEIEAGGRANAGDYYVSGKEIGPGTLPNSNRYDGSVTKMGVKNISAASASMTLDIYKVTDTSNPTGKPGTPTGSASQDTATFSWTSGTAADPESGVAGYHLQVGTTPGASDVFNRGVGNILSKTLTNLGLLDGQALYARVSAVNAAALESSWSNNSSAITINLPTFNGTCLDNISLTFKSIGPWMSQTTYSHYGGSAAQSAAISDSTKTYLQTRVTGPANLSFYWKVSSESGYDFLTFSIDGTDQSGAISGEVDWAQKNYSISAGSHILRWAYAKDPGVSSGSDAAWVDQVVFSGSSGPTITSFTPTSACVGSTVILTGTYLSDASAVMFNGTSATFTANSATRITATVPTGAISGTISVTNGTGTATSSASFTVKGFDLNVDGRVDLNDLARLARYFGTTGFPAEYDLNGDGAINEADVTLLFNNLN